MSNNNSASQAEEFDWIKVKQELEDTLKEESAKDKFNRKFKENPLVPIGCLLTGSALVYGLISFRKGDSKTSQFMMRCRIAAQGFTIVALIGGLAVTALKPVKPAAAQSIDGSTS